MVTQAHGLPFGFRTWTAVPAAAGIWFLSLVHYPRRLHISAMLKCQNKVIETESSGLEKNHRTRLSAFGLAMRTTLG